MTIPNSSPETDTVKIVQCRECGVDVPVNSRYPITAVDCHPRYCLKPNEAQLDDPSY